MASSLSPPLTTHERNLLFLVSPGLWPNWPYLPLVRRHRDKEEEYGVLFDAFTATGKSGFSASVFLTNLYETPDDAEQMLQLPKEVFDTPDEVYASGWRVD